MPLRAPRATKPRLPTCCGSRARGSTPRSRNTAWADAMPPARAAHSGKASLEIAIQQRPSVGLVHITMPDMDGCEVVRRLRQGLPDILLITINRLVQDLSEEQKTQKRPAVRIPSTPATRHCEPPVPLT